MSDKKTRRRRYKLRNLEVDRVDLVDTGANQHAHVVIAKAKGVDEEALLAEIIRRKKKKGAKGSADPERMAAEASDGYPVGKHAMHNQKDHGNWADGLKSKRKELADKQHRIMDHVGPGGSGMLRDLQTQIDAIDAELKAGPPASSPTSTSRPLSEIAREIRRDWGSKVNYAAKPYLSAMASLDSIDDSYYQDDARSVVAYFLSNARSWQGETAKRVKAELKEMLKVKKAFPPSKKPDDEEQSNPFGQKKEQPEQSGQKPPPQQQPPQQPGQQPGQPPMAKPVAPPPAAPPAPPAPAPGLGTQPPGAPGAPGAPQPGMTTSALQSLLQQALQMVAGGAAGGQPTQPRDNLAEFMRQRQAAAPPIPAANPGVGGGPAAPGALPGQPGGRPSQPGMGAPVPGQMGQPPAAPPPQAQPNMPPQMPRTSGELAEQQEQKKWPPKQ